MAKRNRADTHLPLAPGETVPGRQAAYQVESVLGENEYAVVYAAHDAARPWRRVSLKEFAHAAQTHGPSAPPAVFEREARVAEQAADHPLLPNVYEVFSHEGHSYIVQELILGEMLGAVVGRHPALPRRTILKWAVCLCDALALLHARRITVHNLSSSSIRVNPNGYPFLVDLGAARQAAERPSGSGETPSLVGGSDARTDLVALGWVLYEALTGHPPDPQKMGRADVDVTGDLASRSATEPQLARLVARILSPQTEEHFPSAVDLLRELRGLAPPVLLVGAHQLTFDTGAASASQTVRFSNAGGGELHAQVLSHVAWLRCDPPVRWDGFHEVTVHLDAAHIGADGEWRHGRLEVRNVGADAGGPSPQMDERWPIECSVKAPARAQSAPPAPVPRPAAPPKPPAPMPAAVPQERPEGETDIMPKSTVIRLILGVLLLALVIGYVVGNRHQSPRQSPEASVPAQIRPPVPVRAAGPEAPPAGNLLQSGPSLTNWRLEQVAPARATLPVEGTAIIVTVIQSDGKHWHVQFYPKPIGLQEGQGYTLRFRAKADRPCDMPLSAGVAQDDYHQIGLQSHALLTTGWKTFSYPFTAVHVVPQNNRLPVFMVGQKPGRFWVSDVTLVKSTT